MTLQLYNLKVRKNSRIYLMLHLVFLLILNFSLRDFQTSRNVVGEIGLDRSAAHLSLFLLVFILGAFCFNIIAKCSVRGSVLNRNIVNLGFCLVAAWVLIVDLIQGCAGWNMLTRLGVCFLWILSFHFFRNYLKDSCSAFYKMRFWILVLFTFNTFSAIYATFALKHMFGKIIAVNLSYSVIVFLPWIRCMFGKRFRIICYGIVLIVVLLSVKRGAIFVLPLMIIVSMFVDSILYYNKFFTMLKMLVCFIILLSGFVIADNFSDNFLSQRFSSDELSDGSGRLNQYSSVIAEVKTRSVSDLFFGGGSGSSLQFVGTAIHNEWLEFLFCYGIIGVGFYLFFIGSLILRLRYFIRQKSSHSSSYAMAVVYVLFVGLFSQVYFVYHTLYIFTFLGTVEALEWKSQIKI